jgi:hypothetical protein
MMEAIDSFETFVLTRVTRHHIPEDGTLQSSFNLVPLIATGLLNFLLVFVENSNVL